MQDERTADCPSAKDARCQCARNNRRWREELLKVGDGSVLWTGCKERRGAIVVVRQSSGSELDDPTLGGGREGKGRGDSQLVWVSCRVAWSGHQLPVVECEAMGAGSLKCQLKQQTRCQWTRPRSRVGKRNVGRVGGEQRSCTVWVVIAWGQ